MRDRLYEFSDKLKELREKKSELDAKVREVNRQIDEIEMDMIDLMLTEELRSFNHGGVTFSVVTQELLSPDPERKGELWEKMRRRGYKDSFTINSKTLKGTLRELTEKNNGALPKWLNGLIKVAEKNSIRIAKTKKY